MSASRGALELPPYERFDSHQGGHALIFFSTTSVQERMRGKNLGLKFAS